MAGRAPDSDIALDSGPQRRAVERLCVVTRTVRPVSDLIRFVVGPDGSAVPDVSNRLPGRGLWITATQQAVEKAVKRNAFARSFKRDVRLPADLAASTALLLERAALDALAIAGKAGLVAIGYSQAAAALERGEAVALLHAAGASSDGSRKLAVVARRQPRAAPFVIDTLTSAQLDLALGRPNVVHAALLAGPASDTFLSRWQRLERFRAGEADDRSEQAGKAASLRTGRGHGWV